MNENAFATARLDELERDRHRHEWIPIRRHFGIAAFGVNAWRAAEEGEQVIPEHDESSIGHEELYVVVSGRATFTVGGEELDGPAGTIVFVRDPATARGARAEEAGTTILTVGAKPRERFRVSPWELNAEILPLLDSGEWADAKTRLARAVEEDPESAALVYNLACAEAQLGESDAALEHLARAVDLREGFREQAQGDPDLEPIRGDSRFASAIAG
jgi:hypothetical protein